MKRMHFLLMVIVLSDCFFASIANAQQELLPLDKAVRYGKLDNGFAYYVRKNDPPSRIVDVKFVVKAGFLHEDEDQFELSHLLEHMVLKGTKHYPKEAFTYLETLGMRRGDDLNANTGYLYTIYHLSAPADTAGAVLLSLNIARDIATNALLRKDDIAREKAAVISEKLGAEGASMRQLDYAIPKLFGDLFYAKRGVGTYSLKRFEKTTDESLKRFYTDWYRPDLEAIIVVGDINVEVVTKEIKRIFSSIPVAKKPRPLIHYNQYTKNDGKYIVFTDPEQKEVELTLYANFPDTVFRSKSDLQQFIVRDLFGALMQRRFKEIQNSEVSNLKTASYFFSKGGYAHSGLPGAEVGVITSRLNYAQDIKSVAINVMREIERVKDLGFTEEEIQSAKLLCQKKIQPDKKSSNSFVNDYLGHFVEGRSFVDPELLSKLYWDILAKMSISAINSYIQKMLENDQYDVSLAAPENKKDSLPSKELWSSFIREAKSKKLPAYSPLLRKEYIPVMPAMVKQSSIVSKNTVMGVTELSLGNGVRIILKPSKNNAKKENPKISVHGFSRIGISKYSDEDYVAAKHVLSAIDELRMDSLKKAGLENFLKERNIFIRNEVTDYRVSFQGSSSVGDLNILMSEFYSRFTLPAKNENVFNNYANKQKEALVASDPYVIFNDSIKKFIHQESRYTETAAEPAIDKMCKIYEELVCANAGLFTFIVTGDYNEADITPVLLKYLGALNGERVATARLEYEKENNIGVFHEVFYGGEKGKSAIELKLPVRFDYSVDNVFGVKMLEWFLQKRLLARLRSSEGGVYGINVMSRIFRSPDDRVVFSINFQCPSDLSQKLIIAARDEVALIRKQGYLKEDLNEYIAYKRRCDNDYKNLNIYWKFFLDELYITGNGLTDLLATIEVNNNGPKNISAMTFLWNNLLDESKISTFVMLPAK